MSMAGITRAIRDNVKEKSIANLKNLVKEHVTLGGDSKMDRFLYSCAIVELSNRLTEAAYLEFIDTEIEPILY